MKKDSVRNFSALLLFAVLVYFFFTWTLYSDRSDNNAHIMMAKSLFDTIREHGINGISIFKNTSKYPLMVYYPAWHLLVYLLGSFLSIFLEDNIAFTASSSIINSLSVLVMYYLLLKYLNYKHVDNKRAFSIVFLALGLLFVGPLEASKYLGSYYLGAYSGNVWHNPTYLIVRPIAFIILLLYAKVLSEKKSKTGDYIKLAFLLLLSGVIKPSFYQAFLPGLVVYCVVFFLIKRDKKTFFNCLKIAGTCVPVTVFALFQFIEGITGMKQQGGIVFDPLYVWMFYTPNWKLSLVVSILFPALVIVLLAIQKRIDTEILLALSMFASAILQYMCLYIQEKPYAADFCWGFELGIFLIFVVAAKKLHEMTIEETGLVKLVCIILWIVFLLHLLCGVVYFLKIMKTGEFHHMVLFNWLI